MKKKIQRLKLERETIRSLTPNHLEHVDGGSTGIIIVTETYWNSCDLAAASKPVSVCNSCNMAC